MSDIESRRFLVQRYGEEAVVFDCLSGNTHYLNPVANARLEGRTHAQLAESFPEIDKEELAQMISAVDAQFLEWGMIVEAG
ncbi:MAG: hypothetical protein HXY27_02445 [Hydrogenophilaceae bacterium]|jgi:hypothetical protein|nr:hypothetical protein [Hydrogenophilaceae bacterium]